jgi:hypothetical protein
VQLTPPGKRARDIADWAWRQPASRVADARQRVGELMSGTQDPQALREIESYATMVSRLADSLDDVAMISDQAGVSG